MHSSRPLPRLAALFTTDNFRVPALRTVRPPNDPPDQWELSLDDGKQYGLSHASGRVQIVPPEY